LFQASEGSGEFPTPLLSSRRHGSNTPPPL
jgi:hypothetical protein